MSFWMEDYVDKNPAPDWRCWWLGCATLSIYPVCGRCGSDAYPDPDFVQAGMLWLIYGWFRWKLLSWKPVRCQICNIRVGFGPNTMPCCDQCLEKWIPF